ncbi:MAG TPA: acyl-CoA dehydrogenase family protein, partial [Beutenbergiaceae bacterium]|nr:acyl-CoA dehydrogenase family protein [Beutenbergiaceae bacterium]
MTHTFNASIVGDLLDGRWGGWRREVRELMKSQEFRKIEDLPYSEHRERVLSQLRGLVEHGVVSRAFPTEFGGEDDHGGNVAGFEELVIGDPSLQIKAGVQWGLFGSAVLQLGSREHHEAWLPGIMDLS